MSRPQPPPAETDFSFGARVIRYRIRKNLSRKQLAESFKEIASIASIGPKAIQRWENEGLLPRNPLIYAEMIRRLEMADL